MPTLVAGGSLSGSSEIDEQATILASAKLASGGFVLLSTSGIYSGAVTATIFDAAGQQTKAPFQIVAGDVTPDVIALHDGGFAISWAENAHRVMAQIFAADGSAIVSPILVAQDPDHGVSNASLAELPNGNLVASWQATAFFIGTVAARVIDGGGTPLTSTVTTSAGGSVSSNDPIVLADGRALISYTYYPAPGGGGGADSGIRVALFDPLIGAISSANFINQAVTAGSPYGGAITQLASGKILLTWGDASGYRGQLFDTNGVSLSQGFTIPAGAFGAVTALPGGGFAIAYEAGTGADNHIVGQIYDDNSSAVDSAFTISSLNEAESYTPVITAFGSDDLAIAWNYHPTSTTMDASLRLYFSAANGTPADDTLDGTANLDILNGLGGNDTLNGLAGDDLLAGGAGADTLNGGAGLDTADYSDSAAGVTVNLATGLGVGGDAEGDHLNSIEIVVGSAFADTLRGGAGADRLDGGDGDDFLEGGAGADTLIGGNGIDAADYTASSAGVTVNLATGRGSGGDAEGDILQGIERINGSAFADVLTGDGAANVLNGRGGDDILAGGINADTLDGGSGNDTVTYAASTTAVRVNLATGVGQFGDAHNDTYISIENVRGSTGDDVLTGDSGNNRLEGLGGADTLTGGGGDDFLDGGAGVDIAVINATRDAAVISIGYYGDITVTSSDGTDVLRSISTIRFTDQDVAVSSLLFQGTVDDDTFTGDGNANTMFGGAGADVLLGLGGDDVLNGGQDDDLLDGGDGDDVAVFNLNRSDAIVGFAANGDVTIGTPGDTDTLRNIERVQFLDGQFALSDILQLGTSGADDLVAASAGQTVAGLDGNDVLRAGSVNGAGLDGGAGNDLLIAGAGTDRLTGGTGLDTFEGTVASLSGDTIVDLKAGDKIHITDATFGAFTATLTGQTLTYTGGSMTISYGTGLIYSRGPVSIAADPNGGVDITLIDRTAQNDFGADGRSDILWRSASGLVGNWESSGSGFRSSPSIVGVGTDWKIAGTGDFNGDGISDILWRNNNGQFGDWLGHLNEFTPNATLYSATTDWKIAGTGDFDADGKTDILWRNDSGTFGTWSANAGGTGFTPNATLYDVSTDWKIAGTGDFDGDARADILWRNTTTGQFGDWLSTGNGTFSPNATLGASPLNWHIAETGDFNGDGKTDILWRSDSGQVGTWFAGTNGNFSPNATIYSVTNDWKIVDVGDYNGDGRADILWRNTGTGQVGDWLSGGDGSFTPNANLYAAPLDWNVAGDHAFLV